MKDLRVLLFIALSQKRNGPSSPLPPGLMKKHIRIYCVFPIVFYCVFLFFHHIRHIGHIEGTSDSIVSIVFSIVSYCVFLFFLFFLFFSPHRHIGHIERHIKNYCVYPFVPYNSKSRVLNTPKEA